MNCCGQGRTAADSNSLKRGRNGLPQTAANYRRSPFKEEVMGSNPIRATRLFAIGRYAIRFLQRLDRDELARITRPTF